MSEATNAAPYRRQAAPMERLFTRSPFSVVAMVARVRGDITREALEAAVEKVRQRHRNLRVVLIDDAQHNPWFTTKAELATPIQVIPRDSATEWVRVVQEISSVPFDFEQQPAITSLWFGRQRFRR